VQNKLENFMYSQNKQISNIVSAKFTNIFQIYYTIEGGTGTSPRIQVFHANS